MLKLVNVNGTKFVVDAASKAAAKAFGAKKLEVIVTDATKADIDAFEAEGGVIETVVGKTKSEGTAAAAPATDGAAQA